MSPRPLICERVRSQTSILLDAEVSELDRRLVAAHLARCADCRAFEQGVRAVTAELRAAELETPRERIIFSRVRPQRRVWLRTAEFGAAATVLIGVLGVLSQFGAPETRAPSERLTTANLFRASWQPEVELAQLEPAVPTRATDRPGPLPAL